MNDYMIDMFRSPFLHIHIKNWEEKKSKLMQLMNSYKLDHFISVKTTFNNISRDDEIILNQKVGEILSEELNAFSNSFGIDNFNIVQSWFQIEEKNMYHGVHNHGYGISSVCYLDYNEEIHKPVILISPSNNFIDGSSEQFYPENISEGSIIFFPSVVNHYTMPNNTDVLRKILAFNIKID